MATKLTSPDFRVGVTYPQTEISPDPEEARHFAQSVEAMGFTHLVGYDHIVGADTRTRPDWTGPYDLDSTFHEPLVLFGYLASLTKRIQLMTGVIILPQRQLVVFAKQAATLDILCGGRLEVGVGVGWNKVEYDALGVPFDRRGRLLDDYIPVMRRLWTERSVDAKGENFAIDAAGIYPLPVQQPIPIWIGGFSDVARRRAAAIGDGWFPYISARKAEAAVASFREELHRCGRSEASAKLESIIFFSYLGGTANSIDGVLSDVESWRSAGANGVCIDTMRMGLKGADAHLKVLGQLAGDLGLGRNAE